MSDLLNIIITTYDSGNGLRTKCLYATVKSLVDKLVYNKLYFIITDDSPSEHHENNVRPVIDLLEDNLLDYSIISTHGKGVGFAKNNALELAFQSSPYVLLSEDDWELKEEFNLHPHIRTLSEHSDTGMIRFGYLGGEMQAKLTSYSGVTYWELLHKSGFYVYSGQISLRSKHWYDVVGYHVEGVGPGREEEEMCHRYQDMVDVPKILWPADYGCTLNAGLFQNIGLDNSVNHVEPHS